MLARLRVHINCTIASVVQFTWTLDRPNTVVSLCSACEVVLWSGPLPPYFCCPPPHCYMAILKKSQVTMPPSPHLDTPINFHTPSLIPSYMYVLDSAVLLKYMYSHGAVFVK